MDIDSWREVLNPNVKRYLNLNELFSNTNELDLFIMTSSDATTLGSADQSNYAAATLFRDFLARRQRQQDLEDISTILPVVVEVWYIADHHEIETSLHRKGFYGIDESEIFASFEVSMTHQPNTDYIVAETTYA